MLIKKYHLISILIFSLSFCFKMKAQNSYDDLRKKYEAFNKNDNKAIPYVNNYIVKAKADDNYKELVQAFEDMIYFTADNHKKLLYADSCIISAKKTGNNDLISRSYLGKGIIYYLNLKHYKPALDEYVQAYEYSKKTRSALLN